MRFVVSEKQTPHGLLIAITDKEILGRKFEEAKKQLDLTKEFYKGEEKDIDDVKKLFHRARHLHLTGKNVVSLAKKEGLIDEDKVLIVKNIPHAEVFVES